MRFTARKTVYVARWNQDARTMMAAGGSFVLNVNGGASGLKARAIDREGSAMKGAHAAADRSTL